MNCEFMFSFNATFITRLNTSDKESPTYKQHILYLLLLGDTTPKISSSYFKNSFSELKGSLTAEI